MTLKPKLLFILTAISFFSISHSYAGESSVKTNKAFEKLKEDLWSKGLYFEETQMPVYNGVTPTVFPEELSQALQNVDV